MVNRVFCYSKKVASENGNRLPIWQIILTTIIMIVGGIALALITDNSSKIVNVIIILAFGVIGYFSVILGLRLQTKMTGWATTSDGRIFKTMTMNNGQGLYFGGVAAGGIIDQISGNANNIGKNVGGAVGAIAEYKSIDRSSKYMSNPEIIARIVESAPNISGAMVFEILNVYSITDGKHSIKLNCDYKVVNTGKIMYKRNMHVEKSYNQLNDLINILSTHKQ